MIRKIHNSNDLSCPLSGQITEVLLYCHDCIYSIIGNFITIALILLLSSSRFQAIFIAPSGGRKFAISLIKMFTKMLHIYIKNRQWTFSKLLFYTMLLSSSGNSRLVPLTTHFIANALIALITRFIISSDQALRIKYVS